MSDYWVCSDNIDGKENTRIDALVEALKKNGHTAHNGGVGPNTIQSHGQTGGAKGQIGVFICGGVDIQVFWDFVQGIGSYYNYKRFIYVYASDTASSDKWLTCNGAKNTPTVKAWDDNYSGGQGDAIGQTVDAYCKKHKDKIWYACGPLGCSFDDVIKNFLKGEGAGDGGTSSSSSSKTDSRTTPKEAIQKLLTHWDGEVECNIRGDKVYINKIREPQKYYSVVLEERVNVLSDGITLSDINPGVPNMLEVTWANGKFMLKNEASIKRFGENKLEIEATVSSSDSGNENKSNEQTNENTGATDDSGNSSGENNDNTVDNELIDNFDEALSFAQREFNKLQRDNGRVLECKVLGSTKWKTGEWCKVYLPSYGIDGYMYIIRVTQSNESGNWTCSLSLTDYPPGWGEEEEEETTSEETEEVVEEDVTGSDEGTTEETATNDEGE